VLTLWLVCAAGLGAAPAADLAFSNDGLTVVATGRREVQLFSAGTAVKTGSIPAKVQRVTALALDPQNRFLVYGGGTPGESGVVALLDWKSQEVLWRQINFADWVTSVAISSDATRIVAGSADASAFIYPIGTASKSAVAIPLIGHTGPVLSAAWSLDGQLIVTASADRSLKVWSPSDGKLLRSFAHHTEAIRVVVFRPGIEGAAQCASGSDDRTVRIWQPASGRMVRIIRGHGGPVFALAYTPDGSALLSAGKEGIVRHLDGESDQVLGEWKAHDEPIYSLAISPDGSHVATGDWTGRIKLWRFAGGQLTAR